MSDSITIQDHYGVLGVSQDEADENETYVFTFGDENGSVELRCSSDIVVRLSALFHATTINILGTTEETADAALHALSDALGSPEAALDAVKEKWLELHPEGNADITIHYEDAPVDEAPEEVPA